MRQCISPNSSQFRSAFECQWREPFARRERSLPKRFNRGGSRNWSQRWTIRKGIGLKEVSLWTPFHYTNYHRPQTFKSLRRTVSQLWPEYLNVQPSQQIFAPNAFPPNDCLQYFVPIVAGAKIASWHTRRCNALPFRPCPPIKEIRVIFESAKTLFSTVPPISVSSQHSNSRSAKFVSHFWVSGYFARAAFLLSGKA
jgi:hypothetical protein